MSQRTGEIRTLQALRAGACLLVVAYHAIDLWAAGARPPRRADDIWPNAAAGVDLFFVLSGFVMAGAAARLADAPGGWRVFLRHRLRRILPLYWGLTLAKMAILAAMPQRAAQFPGPWQVAASLLFIPARDAAGVVRPVLGGGWTLQFEMLFYAMITSALACRRPIAVVIPPLAALALLGFLRAPTWPAPLALANGLALEFGFGLAVARFALGGTKPRTLAHLALLVSSLTALLLLPPPGPWRFAVWGLPAALILLAAIRLEHAAGALLPGSVVAVGDASYAIYLLHPFVLPPVAAALARSLPASWQQGGAHLAVLLAISLAVSIAGGRVLHGMVDAPLQAWLAGAGWPRRVGAGSASRLGNLIQP